FRMVCRDFILPEPASYVFFYAVFNLRNLLYLIARGHNVMITACAPAVAAPAPSGERKLKKCSS
ncbi:MAG: hypothetical protein KHY01_09835, partial [Firmicutes bacterium]|nr:hypothetical protein [Bacillota bacterium]